MNLTRIFISHAGPDSTIATELARHLKNAGHETTVDTLNLDLGDDVVSIATRLDRDPGKMVSRLASHLVDRYAQEADSVVDPFCGSAAILAAAKRAGVSVAGIDVNPIAELFYKEEVVSAYRFERGGRAVRR